jgi:hypothetical protein
VSGELHAPTALPPEKEPLVPRRLGGPQSSSERGGDEKNSQPPPGIETENSDRSARSLVAKPTQLSWNIYNANQFDGAESLLRS